MILRYLYDTNLAQASYLVGCSATGEALIIDPNRDLERYLDAAKAEGLRISAVTESHIHADFLSGARELAEKSGATLYLSDEGGPDWLYRFPHQGLRDGDSFMVGNIKIEVIHTPGHTPEHLCFLLTDTAAADAPMGLFTGDFIFVGDIGRPDLLEEAAGEAGSKEHGAQALYKSLQRLKELPDYLQLWPGHGAGSACGKALGAVPSTTLGYERRFNWAFLVPEEQAFIRQVLAGQPEPPRYFAQMKRLNRAGPKPRPQEAPEVLADDTLHAHLDEGAMVIDTRPLGAYSRAHIPGTITIPLNQSFANWAGTLLPYEQPLYLIVEESEQSRALTELARVGLDQVAGVWRPSILAQWPEALRTLPEINIETLAAKLAAGEGHVLDVRRTAEYEAGHIAGVGNLPLQRLVDQLGAVPRGKPLYIHCQSGMRSSLAVSYLLSQGFEDIYNVAGGFAGWERAGNPVLMEQEAETIA